jgi:hypothetical protein
MLLEGNGRHALLLKNSEPDAVAPDSLYLCFAVVVQGPDDPILPTQVLDDWGSERRDIKVYEWLEDEGHRFPRSEVFGYDVDGSEAQCFVRALELYVKMPCFVFATKKTPVVEGVRLQAILLPEPGLSRPEEIKRPSQFKRPLSKAKVSWWQVPAASTSFDFSLLNQT